MISESIKKLVYKINPSNIFIPYQNDIHIDHKIINHCCIVASRPLFKKINVNIYEYETLSETEWSDNESFKPIFYNVLSSRDITKKVNAMKCYKSQIKKYPHPRSIEIIKSKAIIRGSTIGKKYAEAFIVKRIIS